MLHLNESQAAKRELAENIARTITQKRKSMGEKLTINQYKELWKDYAKFGLMKYFIPKDNGGLGNKMIDMALTLEGIGRGSEEAGLMFAINAHIWAAIVPILHFGSDAQKNKYLPKLFNAEHIGAHAISEPDAGSDVFGLTTSFKPTTDGYTLSGNKVFITNAPVADLFLIYARSEESVGMKGISCFLVERNNPGLFVGEAVPKMGLDYSYFSEVQLKDCFVSHDALLGRLNGGLSLFHFAMNYERPFLFFFQIGLMEAQLNRCVKYAKTRKQYNQSLINFQSVSNRLAEMKSSLEISRLICHQIAKDVEEGELSTINSSIAKLYISESVVKNSINAMKIHGAYGYTKECGIECGLRDAFAGQFYSGTSDIQKNIISSSL